MVSELLSIGRQIKRLYGLRQLTVYERRKRLQTHSQRGLLRLLNAWFCKVRLLNESMIFDEILNLKYELGSDIGNKLYFEGAFERDDISFLQTRIARSESPIILDIGANIGIHSIMLHKANPSAKIYAFEPSYKTKELLQFNVRCHTGDDMIQVVPVAVSNSVGKATFYEAADNAYSSLKDTKRKPVTVARSVEVTTIDHFSEIAKLKKINLIKIDVEGFESEVIQGGVKTLMAFRPDLFVEIYQGLNSNPNPDSTINLLTSIGYTPYVCNNGKLEPFIAHTDNFYNYFFTFQGRASDEKDF